MRQQVMNLLLGSAGALLLPALTLFGSRFYAWLYQFAHLPMANFDKVQIANDVQSSSH